MIDQSNLHLLNKIEAQGYDLDFKAREFCHYI